MMVLYTVGSKANVGYIQVLHEPGDSCDYYGTLISASNKYCLFVNTKNPSNASGLLDNIKMYVYYCLYYYDDNGINKFIEPYYKICSVYTNSGNYEIRSSSDWLGGSDTSIGYFNPREISHDSLGITMYKDDYIGVLFDFTRTGGTNEKIILPTDDYDTTNHGKYKTDSSLLTSWDLLSYPENGRIYLYGELVEDPNSGGGGEEEENPIGGGIGGTPKQSCHTDSGTYEVGETTTDTWGKLQPQDFGTSGGEDAVYVDIVYPWDEDGEWQTDEVLVDGVTEVFDNPDDPTEQVSYNVNLFIGSPSTMYDIYECWWKESETGDVYVSLDGSDSNFGTYWDDAYRTMTKGVSEVSDGQFVNIDEGIYASETSPFPNNKSCNFEIRTDRIFFTVDTDSGTPMKTTDYVIDTYTYINMDDILRIEPATTVPNTGILYGFRTYIESVSGYIRLKIYREDGDYFRFVGQSDKFYIDTTGETFMFPCEINVQSGDIIGLAGTGNVWLYGSTHSSATRYYETNVSIDNTDDWLKTDMFTSTTKYSPIQAYGLY
jgi:hypothetical protein